ncbi:MAG: hypothetical protein H0U74_22930 [Bradymonadaceae bacterium]|nr:hypothetical protein [Lujinxingiaceae bacterium]
MKQAFVLLVIILLAGAIGCSPASSNRTPTGDADGSVEHDALDAAVEHDAHDAHELQDADTSPEDAALSATITARLVAVDWGLGASVEDPATQIVFQADASGRFRARFTWPPGVHRLVLSVEEEVYGLQGGLIEGLARDSTPMWPGTEQRARSESVAIFSATSEQVELSTNLQNLTIVRLHTAESARLDALPGSANVGALFDTALSALATQGQDPYQVVVTLMHGLFEAGAAPLTTERGTFFIAPGSDEEAAVEVRGSFSDWQQNDQTRLVKILGRLWGRYIPLGDEHHQYKIVFNDGAAWFTDLSNRHIVWDGINPNTIGAFNSVANPASRAQSVGRTVWLRSVHSPELGNQRDVYVHLPPDYDRAPTRRYPVLYVHDGNESIVRSQFHEVADAWATTDATRAIILVFVALPSQDLRMAEYTVASNGARGSDHARFLNDTLVPLIDTNFRTRTDRGARGLVGASLGGLISFWTAAQHPESFGFTAGMSSSFFWHDEIMRQTITELGCQNVRYYLDSGSPADNSVSTAAMRDTLVALDCQHRYEREDGATHDWHFWKGRFPNVLESFKLSFAP